MQSTIHRGNLEISGDGAKHYQHITAIEGYLVTGPNAIIHLPNLAQVKAITLRQGAVVTLPRCLRVDENINVSDDASISLPVLLSANYLCMDSGAKADLPKCGIIDRISMRAGSTANLPVCLRVKTDLDIKDTHIELPLCHRLEKITARGMANVVLPKCSIVDGAVIATDESDISLPNCQVAKSVGATANSTIELPSASPRQAPLTIHSKGKVIYKSTEKPATRPAIDYKAMANVFNTTQAVIF